MLDVSQLRVAYGQSEVLHGIDINIEEGEIVALMGVRPVRSGSIELAGREISKDESFRRVAKGIAYVPQGRMIFSTMTVQENVEVGLTVTGESWSIRSPAKVIAPVRTGSTPVIERSVVVLPTPLRPIRQTRLRSGTVRFTPRRMREPS